jgi:hypothetical protein
MIHQNEYQRQLKDALCNDDMERVKKLIEEMKQYGAYSRFPTEPPRQLLMHDMDSRSGRKTVNIDVQLMVENLLGGPNSNRDVQVTMEHYGHTPHERVINDSLHFIVVNICNLQTSEIITLREQVSKFPSPEFLTKLELLRTGNVESIE